MSKLYSLSPTHAQWCKSLNPPYFDETCELQYCQLYGADNKACEKEYCTAHPNDTSCPTYCKSVTTMSRLL